MKIRLIDGRLGLSGKDLKFKNKDLFGLKVGDKIKKIGDGRENGCIRTDEFLIAVEYMGLIIVNFDEPEEMFAFKVFQKQDHHDLFDENHDDDNFLLYGSTGKELFTEASYTVNPRKSYNRYYAPEFIKENHECNTQ